MVGMVETAGRKVEGGMTGSAYRSRAIHNVEGSRSEKNHTKEYTR